MTDARSARLDELLVATSRTFALSIPLLPPPLHSQVTVAYLLLRIADTFEDASEWQPRERIDALNVLNALLRRHDMTGIGSLAAQWQARPPSAHAGYLQLLAETPLVLETFAGLPMDARAIVREHVSKSVEGMAEWVGRTTADGRLELRTLDELRRYCYVVAGIVGEMLTELFLLALPRLADAAPLLRARSRAFGEGLQLVNVLKDAADDSLAGRTYIPPGADRREVFALARAGLAAAAEYILALETAAAPPGVIAFAALPVALARATLDRVECEGPGAKLTRAEVRAIVSEHLLRRRDDGLI